MLADHFIAPVAQRASWKAYWWRYHVLLSRNMMTSSNGNTFHITGPLWRESTGDRWIPLTEASGVELWCFLWLPEQTVEQTVGTPSPSLWRHCNDFWRQILTYIATETYGLSSLTGRKLLSRNVLILTDHRQLYMYVTISNHAYPSIRI